MTGRLCPLLAHSVGSLRRINSVAIGAKRTLGASTIAAASIIRNNFAYLHSSFLDGLDGSGRHLDFKKCPPLFDSGHVGQVGRLSPFTATSHTPASRAPLSPGITESSDASGITCTLSPRPQLILSTQPTSAGDSPCNASYACAAFHLLLKSDSNRECPSNPSEPSKLQ